MPKTFDSAEAVCLSLTYTVVFQTLNYNVPKWRCYDDKGLLEKNALVVECDISTRQAIIKIAFLLGASRVYKTIDSERHDFFKSPGASPIINIPEERANRILGKLHLIFFPWMGSNIQYQL